MSIIRDAFAEEMRLESKPIAILIAKVGETEEEINAKLYKVPILATNGRATQTIEAMGMPQVSHDTTTINIDQVSEMFGLSKSEVHRKPGPIDILVGINYPNFHTGETKVKDGLVARRSPLGWVIFGANSQSSSSKQNKFFMSDLPHQWISANSGKPNQWEYLFLHAHAKLQRCQHKNKLNRK